MDALVVLLVVAIAAAAGAIEVAHVFELLAGALEPRPRAAPVAAPQVPAVAEAPAAPRLAA